MRRIDVRPGFALFVLALAYFDTAGLFFPYFSAAALHEGGHLLALWGLREKRWLSQVWGPILALILAEALSCDYGWKGVLLVILLVPGRVVAIMLFTGPWIFPFFI